MKILVVQFTKNNDLSDRFYRAMGLIPGYSTESREWIELEAEGGKVAIHSAKSPDHDVAPGAIELSFESEEALEIIQARMRSAGFDPGHIEPEPFGRSLRLVDPNGTAVQINEGIPATK
ncbi:VOC family protein [Rathayibacter agropyri]|uniref:VOC family protein n=1 Tax=Rathayibacter agropyri TaxID=1634927 RepID=UPI0015636546|nr:VOC family protein [Rathayibacter agropyri]NRD08348.1 VOC family protein [Rathayibacter agropyri]